MSQAWGSLGLHPGERRDTQTRRLSHMSAWAPHPPGPCGPDLRVQTAAGQAGRVTLAGGRSTRTPRKSRRSSWRRTRGSPSCKSTTGEWPRRARGPARGGSPGAVRGADGDPEPGGAAAPARPAAVLPARSAFVLASLPLPLFIPLRFHDRFPGSLTPGDASCNR